MGVPVARVGKRVNLLEMKCLGVICAVRQVDLVRNDSAGVVVKAV